MAATTTRDRIIAAAEALFAEQGFATSLRAITGSADVNLAAVNYHFGSKEELIREVFARRLEPLNRERIALLDRIEGERSADPSLEPIIESFIGPALRMSHDPGGATFMRLYGHTLSRRDDDILSMLTEQFSEVIRRYTEALGRTLPDLEPREVFWRFMFMVGAMAHTMALSDKLPELSHGICDIDDVEETIGRLVPFIAGGMRAARPRTRPGAVR